MAGRAGAGGGYKEIVSGRQPAQIMRAPLNIGFDLRGHALILTLFFHLDSKLIVKVLITTVLKISFADLLFLRDPLLRNSLRRPNILLRLHPFWKLFWEIHFEMSEPLIFIHLGCSCF